MSAKNEAEVLIGGKVLTLSGYESQEYLQKVAAYLNNKLTDCKQSESFRRQALELQNIMIQLNIADDYFKAKKIADTLENTEEFSLFEEDELDVVEYGLKEEKKFFNIEKDSDGIFNVTGEKLLRLFEMTDFDSDTGRARFARQLRTYGLDDELRKLGVKNGDTVRIFDFEFEFID